MNAPLRRNACPSLAAPMPTGDGLLARLAFVSGAISPQSLAHVAGLGARHGNGILEVTRRGSLQIRGLTAGSAARLAEDIARTGLDIRTGTTIDVSALAGLDPACAADPRAIAQRLRAALAETGLTGRLAPKMSVVIDGGGQLAMDEVLADVRILAADRGPPARWTIEVARRDAPARGGPVHDEAGILELAVRLLAAVADLGRLARAKDLPDEAVTAILGPALPIPPRQHSARQPLGLFDLAGGRVAAGIALPCGQASAAALQALAAQAAALGIPEFRFAPGHALLAICGDRSAADAIRAAAKELDFVVEPDDPRRRIVACAGAPACASGFFDTRGIAAALIAGGVVEKMPGTLHLSGCMKKCSEPPKFSYAVIGTSAGARIVDGATGRDAMLVAKGEIVAGFERLLQARSVDAHDIGSGGRERPGSGA